MSERTVFRAAGLPGRRKCAATGCANIIPSHRLMCGKCWRLVPPGLKALVFAEYNPHTANTLNGNACHQIAGAFAVASVALVSGMLSQKMLEATAYRICEWLEALGFGRGFGEWFHRDQGDHTADIKPLKRRAEEGGSVE